MGQMALIKGFQIPSLRSVLRLKEESENFSPFICEAVQALRGHQEIGNPIAGQRGKVSKLIHKQTQGLESNSAHSE